MVAMITLSTLLTAIEADLLADQRLVSVVCRSPCRNCLRDALFLIVQPAVPEVVAWLNSPLLSEDVHNVMWMLEQAAPQFPIGTCPICGAQSPETASESTLRFSRRIDLGHQADDLSFEYFRLYLGNRVCWTADDPQSRRCAGPESQWVNLTPSPEAASRARAYVMAKAKLFVALGADRYRAQDGLQEPDGGLSDFQMAGISWAIEQFAVGVGFDSATPLTRVPADVSHALMRELHFDILAQRAERTADGLHFHDQLLCQHVVDPTRRIIIHNRVPTRRFECIKGGATWA